MRGLLRKWVEQVERVEQPPAIPVITSLPVVPLRSDRGWNIGGTGGTTRVALIPGVPPVPPPKITVEQNLLAPETRSGRASSNECSTCSTCSTEKHQVPELIEAVPEFSPAIAHLVAEYLEIYRGLNDLTGDALRAASDRVLALGKKIDRQAPGFDWLALWAREGVPGNGDGGGVTPGYTLGQPSRPTPAAREWTPDALKMIAWLETAPVPSEPFQLDEARKVTEPAVFVAALRRDVARGPQGERARGGMLIDDLRRFRAVTERTVM